jgi:hypothetical protein
MPPSSPLLRAVSTTATAAALALAITLPTGGTALADPPEPTDTATTATTAPGCPEGCTTAPATTGAGEQGPTKTAKPEYDSWLPAPTPAAEPAAPSATAPAAPATSADAAAAAGPEETAAAESPAEETAGPTASAPTTAAPSSESNWNKPVTSAPKASQAGSVARAGDGPGGPNLPAVAAGVLLVGVGGGSFAWWGRNRLRAH